MQGNVNIPDSTITTNLSFRQLVLMNMQQLTNFPYIEKDFDALTDYELLCLVVKFLNDVIANQNEQNASITRMYESFLSLQDYVNNTKDTLEDAFNNLDDYVRNYFDNLDVQEEINNKLDQMLEDGVLEQIIEQFLQLTSLICFNNVADMKSSVNLANGSYAKTLGYYSKNDGGGTTYKVRQITNEDIVDEMLIIALNNQNLVAELIVENNEINIQQLGAHNDGVTNNNAIFNKINSLIPTYNIILDKGTYLVTDSIIIESNANGGIIKGAGKWKTNIKFENNGRLTFNVFHRYTIEEIHFIDNRETLDYPMINILDGAHLSIFNNCIFTSNMGVNVRCAYMKFDNCSFVKINGTQCQYLLQLRGEYGYVNNCYFDGNQDSTLNDTGLILQSNGPWFINNCDICNFINGIGLQLLPLQSGSLNDIGISNTIFMRNKISIDANHSNNSISNVNLNNITFAVITGNEEKCVNIHRDTGATSIFSGIFGNCKMSGIFNNTKTMFSCTQATFGGKLDLNITDSNNLFPDYSTYFPLNPINPLYDSAIIVSGSSTTIEKTICSNSPYRVKPHISYGVIEGAGPTNVEIQNTYKGALKMICTFTSSTPYCALLVRIN